jgi:hypothetical protein
MCAIIFGLKYIFYSNSQDSDERATWDEIVNFPQLEQNLSAADILALWALQHNIPPNILSLILLNLLPANAY